MVIEQRLYTVDEYEAIVTLPENSERRLELIHGEIVEKMSPTQEHGLITGNIYAALYAYVKQHKIGRVTIETRHKVSEDARNSRIPDISFVAGNAPLVTEGAVPQMPDFAAEVLSPDDSIRLTREKARFYLKHGTRLVWLVYPELRIVEVYTPEEELILGEKDTLSGYDVFDGFELPVSDVFTDMVES